MADEPDNLVLRMLREIRAELATKPNSQDMRAGFGALRSEIADVRHEVADIRADMRSMRADVASDLIVMRKELSEQIVGLRRAVVDYHTSIVGHGVLISDLDARLRRVEAHLDLPPLTTA